MASKKQSNLHPRIPRGARSGLKHLRGADLDLGKVIDVVGPFRMNKHPASLMMLCRSIVGQQLSIVVAAKINGRFRDLVGENPSARKILSVPVEDLRTVGLSQAKANSVRQLATFWGDHRLSEKKVETMSDEELIALLTQVKGIGPWTVKMFLMFSLQRPDVLPFEDYGLRAGMRRIYELDEMPTPKQVQEMAAPWRPWSSVASWYCWQILNT